MDDSVCSRSSQWREWSEQTCEQINVLQFDKMSELGGGEMHLPMKVERAMGRQIVASAASQREVILDQVGKGDLDILSKGNHMCQLTEVSTAGQVREPQVVPCDWSKMYSISG